MFYDNFFPTYYSRQQSTDDLRYNMCYNQQPQECSIETQEASFFKNGELHAQYLLNEQLIKENQKVAANSMETLINKYATNSLELSEACSIPDNFSKISGDKKQLFNLLKTIKKKITIRRY